jgi:hypothetical protein
MELIRNNFIFSTFCCYISTAFVHHVCHKYYLRNTPFDVYNAIILIVGFPNTRYIRHVSSSFSHPPTYFVRVCGLRCVGPCFYDGGYNVMFVYYIAHVNNCPTSCNNIQIIYVCKLLYIFRVVTPLIIRSSYHYIRYDDMSSWWWVELPLETRRAVYKYK